MMTPEEMRAIADVLHQAVVDVIDRDQNKAAAAVIEKTLWLLTAEICERLDAIPIDNPPFIFSNQPDTDISITDTRT